MPHMIPEMQKFIELLESQLGYSEKSGGYTKFGSWYGKTVEFDADYTSAPWCDMYLSWAAKQLGYEEWVGQFAYTVYHAEWFRQQDAWGTTPKPGALVFFDWGGSDSVDRIDHVGIVTAVEGGRIHTIEGNIDGGVAKRKQRDTDKVVGYGYPEKIKIRLDREAQQKQTILNPDSITGPAGPAGPTVDLPGFVGAPTPAPTPAPARSSTGPGATKAPPKHARQPTEQAREQAPKAEASSGATPGKSLATKAPRSDQGTGSGAQAPAVAGRGAPGKHAKASTADTSALATSPAAATSDHTGYTAELGTPTVLAPVLLAAVAILVHTRAKQTRLRFAAAAAARVAPVAPPRRSPGRRRAPGRRRMPRNVPVTVRPAAGPREAAGRPREIVSAATSFTPAVAAGFPAVTTPVDLLGETPAQAPRDDRPRAPYQGRRRLHERPVVESSTFVQDAPLRGRRHRRTDSMVSTTIPAGPARPASSTASTAATVSVPAPPGGRGRPTRTGTGASPVGGAPLFEAATPVEQGDILVHSGYQGRRRAKVMA